MWTILDFILIFILKDFPCKLLHALFLFDPTKSYDYERKHQNPHKMHRILITIRRRYTSRRSAIFSSEYLPSRTICSKHLLQVLNSVFLAFLSLPHSIFFYLIRFHFFPFFFLPCFDF